MGKSKLLLLALIAIAAIYLYSNKSNLDLLRQLFSKFSHGGSPPDSQSAAAPAADAAQTQSVVEAYIRKNTVPGRTISFLEWSNFSTSGPTSFITLRYRIQKANSPDFLATVRVTIQSDKVLGIDLLSSASPLANSPTAPSTPRPFRPPPIVVDHFTSAIFAARAGGNMSLHLDSAFSLSQLDQAKAKAVAEKKPLGFLMVWGQFFDHDEPVRGKDSVSALVHFYQVFNDQLVLVFVRHESELGKVPPAVSRGFRGPDEGGYAPNMAVTDATATEFVVEIPYRCLDGDGRDPIFAAGGKIIDQWLATHPDALPTPPP